MKYSIRKTHQTINVVYSYPDTDASLHATDMAIEREGLTITISFDLSSNARVADTHKGHDLNDFLDYYKSVEVMQINDDTSVKEITKAWKAVTDEYPRAFPTINVEVLAKGKSYLYSVIPERNDIGIFLTGAKLIS